MSLRIVIADDHPLFRFGLAAALTAVKDLEVVAEASDGRGLIAAVDEHQPDVVLTDLSMPGMDGADATATIRGRHPDTAVVVLTMHQDDPHIRAALRAGTCGYLLKGADREEIVRAVQAAAAGQMVYDQAIGRRLLDVFATAEQHHSNAFPGLTRREHEILDLMAGGHGNHEIARRLVLSEKTVRNNVSQIFLKLAVTDRSAAIVLAREAGLGQCAPDPQP